jgi:hypothetical protein
MEFKKAVGNLICSRINEFASIVEFGQDFSDVSASNISIDARTSPK